jgi:hypothetical protein
LSFRRWGIVKVEKILGLLACRDGLESFLSREPFIRKSKT